MLHPVRRRHAICRRAPPLTTAATAQHPHTVIPALTCQPTGQRARFAPAPACPPHQPGSQQPVRRQQCCRHAGWTRAAGRQERASRGAFDTGCSDWLRCTNHACTRSAASSPQACSSNTAFKTLRGNMRTEMASAEMRCSRAARCCILRPVEAAVMAATTVGPLYVRASSVAGVMAPDAAM